MRTRSPNVLWLALACAMVAACGGDDRQGTAQLTVMTRNLYLGADLDTALAATTNDFVAATTAIWAMVKKNDFTDRAKALAAEIATDQPDLVALQEVALWRTQTPGDSTTATPTPATAVVYDFLALLRAELQARGLSYDVAVALDLTDLEVPTLGAAGITDVRFSDRDVILARSGVTVSPEGGHVFTTLLPVTVAGVTQSVKRGWSRVTATVGGQPVVFVNTHLEADSAAVRTAQANELVAALAGETGRVVLAGDLNSDPGAEGHLAATSAGFSDAWTVANPGQQGLTCCFGEDLTAAAVPFHSRIDLVLTRGALGATSATITGAEAQGRTAGGRWHSDHAGVVARLDVQ